MFTPLKCYECQENNRDPDFNVTLLDVSADFITMYEIAFCQSLSYWRSWQTEYRTFDLLPWPYLN